ncbi:transposable element Tcb2 transposase [Trichonephila clavipes]|uniref:Transposable element Tcb2 transposase n=1 Tax=Trichonephila clavipes TaxID=2585209 RepID=A0A8X7BCL2_TRICX|nr:transposable element Tcb2 transposase [Trichonephila clavipes]
MARRNHLVDFTRGRRIRKLKEGRTVTSKAAEFGINTTKCRFAHLESILNHRGSVIGDRYCEEVLLPHVRLVRATIGPDFIFMENNARPHRTLAVEELLESEDITRMDWPEYSSDLNPIEHVWDALGRRIAARLHHPENT